MAKTSHIRQLPPAVTPERSSVEMFAFFVQRFLEGGEKQKALALSLGFGQNVISQLKAGTSPIPWSRVPMFADALRLSQAERFEFLNTRLIELHGEKSEICVHTVNAWAEEIYAPTNAEAALIDMWRRAAAPAPNLVSDVLDEPTVAEEIFQVIERAVQRRLAYLADEAKTV